MATEANDFICASCRKIDFRDLMKNQDKYEGGRERSPYVIQYSLGCKVCELLFEEMIYFEEHQEGCAYTYELRSESFKKNSQWAPKVSNDWADSTTLYIMEIAPSYGGSRSELGITSCRLKGDGLHGPCCAEIVSDVWDCGKARSWLDDCARHHGDVCQHDPQLVAGMNLIDCENMVIVKAAEGSCWLALSYVWGANYQPSRAEMLGYREGSTLDAPIPATVKDAIHVTLRLGHRYLWVDEYCIDQSDVTHRKEQIERMDQIYQGASLTIVAAAGTNKAYGLPGVLTTRRKDRKVVRIDDVILFSNGPDPCEVAEESKWFTRAWTFQEGLLSRRLLIFTDYQMMFQCSTTSTKESLGQLDSTAISKTHDFLVSRRLFSTIPLLDSRNWDKPSQFTNVMKVYSARQSSYEADTLVAFSGVRNHILRAQPFIYNLRGLPFFAGAVEDSREASQDDESDYINHRAYNFDSIEDLTSAALSWILNDPVEGASPRIAFPSWTWARWPGQATWMLNFIQDKPKTYLRSVQLEILSGQVIRPSLPWKTGHNAEMQHDLDAVTLIQFETREFL